MFKNRLVGPERVVFNIESGAVKSTGSCDHSSQLAEFRVQYAGSYEMVCAPLLKRDEDGLDRWNPSISGYAEIKVGHAHPSSLPRILRRTGLRRTDIIS